MHYELRDSPPRLDTIDVRRRCLTGRERALPSLAGDGLMTRTVPESMPGLPSCSSPHGPGRGDGTE